MTDPTEKDGEDDGGRFPTEPETRSRPNNENEKPTKDPEKPDKADR